MKRLIMLGLLGLSTCKQELPPVEENPSTCPIPGNGLGSAPSTARTPVESTALTRRLLGPDEEGREPVLVRFRQHTGVQAASAPLLRQALVERMGGQVKYHWRGLSMLAARLSPLAREALAHEPEILSIEPDHPVHALGLTSPHPSGSPGEYTEGVKRVQAPEVWDANGDGLLDPGAPTGEGLKVCVIDSGIDDRHPELRGPYLPGQGLGKDFIDGDDDPKDQDENGVWGGGHGTHVAGIIAAQLGMGGWVDPTDSTLHPNGVVGVAPGVTLLVARVLDTQGNGAMSDVIEALGWCQQQGARIASLSLGSTQAGAADKDAFDAAWAAGMLSISAMGNAGNDDPDNPPPEVYPAAYASVLAVGAVDSEDQHPSFSQLGEHLSLVAPGVGVLSTTLVGDAFSEVEAEGELYSSRGLAYAGRGQYTGTLLDCGQAASASSCPETACDGFVAFVERGTLPFADKVRNVQAQGARAVIIANNDPAAAEGSFTLGNPGDWPPVVSVSQVTARALVGRLGRPVRVELKGSDYARRSGTSIAVPHVSAAAALLWSARPGLTRTQVRDFLERSAKELGPPGRDPAFGFGLVQARAALELMAKELP
ncbi:S8 family serine peptidase [Archangium gephyra]|uniref:S8 family serine peptidase n=1 Tax=Archangium gephyra TaxID=48 RepID=UPI0035D459A2